MRTDVSMVGGPATPQRQQRKLESIYLKTSLASPRVSRPSVGSSTNGSFPERSRRRSFIISTQDEVYPAYFPLTEYLIDLHDLDGLWKCESKGISGFAILSCAAATVEPSLQDLLSDISKAQPPKRPPI